MKISFILNKKQVCADVDDRMTLLYYLRGILCMKGSKEACGMGQCGACSVIIDGRLARSCVVKMKNLSGKTVESIEGISQDGELSVIQKAFLDAGAVQCGFCTPGMVMAATVLLRNNPSPGDDEIKEGLKHNYCRCTGYVKIIEAIRLAAARLRGEEPSLDDVRREETVSTLTDCESIPKPKKAPAAPTGFSVGKRVWDVDGPQKVTGSLKYCDDFEADEFGEDEMLHGAFVWAPVPHARLLHVDVEKASCMKGVVKILTAKDVPGLNKIGAWTPDQPIFCEDEVRFLGDFIALVVADSELHAREAAGAVEVSFEPLPGIYTMKEGHEKGSYLVKTERISGDVEKWRKDPAIVKLSVSKEIEPQDHVCMEPVSAIGYGRGDHVTVYSCTQAPFEIRTQLSKNLNLPPEKIRVKATPLGGGFGKKCDAYLEAAAGLAGYLCQKPVKITLSRNEDLKLTTKRHGYHTDYEIGFTKQGKFQYLRSRMFSDGGPYEAESYGTLMTGCLMSGGPYIIPNVDVKAYCIKDNNLQGGAFRGYGINQAAISIETALDEMAEKLGMDPFELRRKNAVMPGSYSVGGELLYSSMGMLETINRCEEALKNNMEVFKKRYENAPSHIKIGWGIACAFKNVGVGKGIFIDDGACRLRYGFDGHLHMIVSGTDMGQGFRTAMVQIAAEVLKVDPAMIDITVGDTDICIPTGETVAERQTLCDGRAVYEACMLLKKELAENPLKPGQERKTEYYYRAPECFPIGAFKEAREKKVPYRNFPAYAYGTQAAIVEVNTQTGQVRLLKVIAAHDVGRVINPLAVEGQMQGSCSMGQGYALTEGFPTRDGYPVKTSYRELGLPRACDTPEYELIFIEDPEPLGPYGAKGVSEVATVPITPAILNAIYNAIGVRINKVPASKQVILEALKEKECRVEVFPE